MLYNGWVLKRKLWALAALCLSGCAPPKQATFTLEGCEATSGAGAPEQWRWHTEPSPVIERGPAGAWDGVDALNPSVVHYDGRFWNLYSGYDGRAWHTGLAVSPDGRRWQKQAGPVLSPLAGTWEGDSIAANGAALHDGREFLYWYQAGRPPRIGLARSADARAWRRHGPPVLEPGAEGSWDEQGVADPYLIRCGDVYYMYYLGQNRRAVQRIGVARSADGVRWQKYLGNPVLDLGSPGSFDERGLGEPAVFRAAEEFYMIYTGRNAVENRGLGVARSADGVQWRRAALAAPLVAAQGWNSRAVVDATLWAGNGRLWMWFGGGDVASPDQGLHGRIGLATMELR